MSSYTRCLQRSVSPSAKNPPRKNPFNGRGANIGVNNPRDTCLLARQAREAKRAAL